MRGYSAILVFCVLFSGCRTEHEDLTGINWEEWKEDRNGCLGKRSVYLQSLSDQVDKLKARSEMEIVELMGRPDQTELYKRNQKFYTYYFEKGPGCVESDSSSKKLVIRFNALGLAKEVALE